MNYKKDKYEYDDKLEREPTMLEILEEAKRRTLVIGIPFITIKLEQE